ncbi:hypothetical protein, partial [Catenulispora pinisilvae]|uniref:hypothetical protein n=1 Tax=Catenulispora pinisilvae TaxID=2705253 RepID=UPI001891E748
MITLIEPADDDDGGIGGDDANEGIDGDAIDGDDELTVLLRPGVHLLAPPPGSFQQIRRRAARRRLIRAATTAGVGVGTAMAIAVVTVAVWPSGNTLGPTPVAPHGPPVQKTSVPSVPTTTSAPTT